MPTADTQEKKTWKAEDPIFSQGSPKASEEFFSPPLGLVSLKTDRMVDQALNLLSQSISREPADGRQKLLSFCLKSRW